MSEPAATWKASSEARQAPVALSENAARAPKAAASSSSLWEAAFWIPSVFFC